MTRLLGWLFSVGCVFAGLWLIGFSVAVVLVAGVGLIAVTIVWAAVLMAGRESRGNDGEWR